MTENPETNGQQTPEQFGRKYIEFLKRQTEGEGGAYLEHTVLEPPLVDAFGDISGKDVIEVGCGFGMHTQRLLLMGPRRIRAIDLSADMLALAEANIDDPSVRFYNRSAACLRPGEHDDDHFNDLSFDVATSAFVLENMPNDVVKGTFSEVSRVLKIGGIYVVVQMHPDWLLLISGKGATEPLDRFRRYNEPHVVTMDKTGQHTYTRFYRPNEWYNMTAGELGLCIIRDQALCIPMPEEDEKLPAKYHPKAGWPVFRLTTWKKCS